jgi:diadenosine tetraphosphate (Ap4A) HIT family hydrolase
MKPRSEFHYLVIPKEHIGSIDDLSTSEHLQLLEHMRQVGIKSVAEQIRSKNLSLDRHPLLVAFHVPPFYTIDHLHMHILSSSTFVSKKASFYFQNPSMWCLHYDTVIEQVQQRMNQQKKEE